jgi:hypothetical protein
LPASVRQRLLNLANLSKQDFGLLLTKYALEHLLYRLLDQGGGSAEHYRKIFIVAVFAEGDGLILLPDTIRVGRIRDEEEYDGVRVFAC